MALAKALEGVLTPVGFGGWIQDRWWARRGSSGIYCNWVKCVLGFFLGLFFLHLFLFIGNLRKMHQAAIPFTTSRRVFLRWAVEIPTDEFALGSLFYLPIGLLGSSGRGISPCFPLPIIQVFSLPACLDVAPLIFWVVWERG